MSGRPGFITNSTSIEPVDVAEISRQMRPPLSTEAVLELGIDINWLLPRGKTDGLQRCLATESRPSVARVTCCIDLTTRGAASRERADSRARATKLWNPMPSAGKQFVARTHDAARKPSGRQRKRPQSLDLARRAKGSLALPTMPSTRHALPSNARKIAVALRFAAASRTNARNLNQFLSRCQTGDGLALSL